jgi:hypothetical protein
MNVVEPAYLFLLFEDLFECSCVSNFRVHFEMFEEFLEKFGGLGAGLTDSEADKINGLKLLQLRTTRICKSLMKKLALFGDTNLNFQIQRMLAKQLPLKHSSGLNVSGRFSD